MLGWAREGGSRLRVEEVAWRLSLRFGHVEGEKEPPTNPTVEGEAQTCDFFGTGERWRVNSGQGCKNHVEGKRKVAWRLGLRAKGIRPRGAGGVDLTTRREGAWSLAGSAQEARKAGAV